MMWDLSSSGPRHVATHSVAMPIPSFAPQPVEHGRPSSVPGSSTPGWTSSRMHTPMPMPSVPPSFIAPDSGPYSYEPTPRGYKHQKPPPQRHHPQPVPPAPHQAHRKPHRQHAPPPPKKHHAHFATQPVTHQHPPIPAASPHFMYSKCTGRRRALCIGINYRGQSHELRGCINDAKHVFNFLVRRMGYKAEDIVVLTDDSPHPRAQPTRKNILDAMRWLVSDARPHDSLFFHYSGHGGQTRDLDGDEVDGYDEVIYPLDYKRHGHIIDDEMHAIMVKPLPSGCRLTAVFDSCHSGTALDLPYIYDSHGRLKGRHVSDRARARKATPADVISLSGCKDGQTSADTFAGGVAVGAASHAFIKAIEMHPRQSYQEIMHNIRMILHPKFSQKPQLASSHPIDTSLRFIM
ncbi:caspase domain-containing protein [Mycena belliarum]|uniref:Caspase domain-containing protein n=1 Tax=Mycena belliarum TaxID=1033014 RepID=A0AAD6TNW7_9AGAR|nr:caspase domain-containing protein [Mycena belliae]